ncbi:hypothetical protein NM208_g7626 [Fusarium decemcellulare]|uniref:Uncharacterized protein n=1 Tax=Fusarium decemcellulare TaxID=57161 RepID=A0ACC1S8K6_9HYPO|nr:hypothetical protein NM208_g7626 [Fusarium decemcellulare]
MAITHIVLFQFKQDAAPEAIEHVCNQMLELKDNCLHPSTGKPYIRSASGGKDNSPEGAQGGITHAFISEFENATDRDYYVAKDPVHQSFVQSVGGVVERAQVVDFTNGVL